MVTRKSRIKSEGKIMISRKVLATRNQRREFENWSLKNGYDLSNPSNWGQAVEAYGKKHQISPEDQAHLLGLRKQVIPVFTALEFEV